MQRQEMKRRLRELVVGFSQAKLCLTPRSVEIRGQGDALAVRVNGFLAPAERAMIDHPGSRRTMENYYLRLFDQIGPLLRVAIGAGGPLLNCQTRLDLPRDECLFILTLEQKGGVSQPLS